MSTIVVTLQHLIKQYGLIVVFVYLFLENSLILHFIPNELVMPFAVIELVHGWPSFGIFVIVATAGATAGSYIPYYVSKVYGRTFIRRITHVSKRDIGRFEGWFQSWGGLSVLWGQWVPIVRGYISIPAGLADMGLVPFTIYTTAGTLVSYILITYFLYTESGVITSVTHWALHLVL